MSNIIEFPPKTHYDLAEKLAASCSFGKKCIKYIDEHYETDIMTGYDATLKFEKRQGYDLAALRAAANRACELAFEKRAEIGGAINWGDLGCHGARRYEDDRGEVGYVVLIEEASNDATELMYFIIEELRNWNS